jgi:hypothetical protein
MVSNIVKFAVGAAVVAGGVAAVVAYKRRTVDPVRVRANKLEAKLTALNERRLKTADASGTVEAIENEMAIVAWNLGQAYGELMYADARAAYSRACSATL